MIEKLQIQARNAVAAMENGNNHVQQCVKQADRAGGALNNISKSIQNIQRLNEQIATAAEEQSHVVNSIGETAKSNKDLANETANATEQTQRESDKVAILAQKLESSVSGFNV